MFVLQGSMLCLLLRGLNNSWIIDSVYTIKRHAYPVIMSVQTAEPEHGPCAIVKNSICKFSGELYSGCCHGTRTTA